MTLITATGREIECSAVVRSATFPLLHIYTAALSPSEIFEIFQNPEETKKMIAVEDGVRRVYRNYIRLHSVSPTSIMTGKPEMLIWMDYYEPDDEEE